MHITHVAIGIQQRLKSSRLPYKAAKDISGRSLTQHVIDQVRKATTYINRHTHRTNIKAQLYLLIPEDDEAIMRTIVDENVTIIKGPEKDVLARYNIMVFRTNPDYIVRVTGDCPLIPSPVITKLIVTAVKGEYDFVTNAWPEYRTFYDGADCEVVSRRLFDWVYENAEGTDREHVLSLLYRQRPEWASFAQVFSEMDLTHVKLSVDTIDDLKQVRIFYDSVENKIKSWDSKYGKKTYHRY